MMWRKAETTGFGICILRVSEPPRETFREASTTMDQSSLRRPVRDKIKLSNWAMATAAEAT